MSRIIAWDFDGVLNRNVIDGRFIWSDTFEQDLGLPLSSFTSYVFEEGRFREVLWGRGDLRALVQDWLNLEETTLTADAFLRYWFERDAHPDAEVLGWVDRLTDTQVIATNNEAHRARFLWEDMGFSRRMTHLFAAGPMKAAKPDASFFQQIETWAGPTAELLLIDDHPPNIEAAQALGWEVFHFTDATRADLPGVLGL